MPRRELLQEPFLDWPHNIDPEMIDHIHRLLFDGAQHPLALSVPEIEDARRLERVANGEGFGIAVLPAGFERGAPRVVFRPVRGADTTRRIRDRVEPGQPLPGARVVPRRCEGVRGRRRFPPR